MCEQNRFTCIDGFGEELDEYSYEGMSNWLLSFRSLSALFGGHYSYLIVHLSIISCGVLTLRHAKANGSRYIQFWLGAMIHGVLSENGLAATKYWHAQALVMLFGKRLPLHMVFFYPSVLYLAVMAVQNFNLSIYAEPAAVGLLAMIVEIPFRIISVKFLHITYHDTDPIYAFKFYGVPWIEIFSALVFATSYIASFYALKYHFLSEDDIKWTKVEYNKKEAAVSAAAGLVGTISGFLQKVFFFHVLYDSFNISPPTCLLLLFALYFSVVFSGEAKVKEKQDEEQEAKMMLYYALLTYILCLLYISILCKPQNEVSIGGHEPTGDCTTLLCTRSPLGKVIKRKKYLCVDDVMERKNFVYNFACLPEGPPYLNAVWYTICGTQLRNRAQFITNIFSFAILISTIFLKGWLTENEKKWLMEKFSKVNSIRQFFLERPRREPVVTFEEPGVAEEPRQEEEAEEE